MATPDSNWPRHIQLLLLNRLTKLDRKQENPMSFTVCVFRADRKTKMATLASDRLRHFDFSSATIERNTSMTKIDGKQDRNVLYQVCVCQADRKTKMTALAADWPIHFQRLLLRNRWTECKETLQQDLNVFYQVCVFQANLNTKLAAPALDLLIHFQRLSAEQNLRKPD